MKLVKKLFAILMTFALLASVVPAIPASAAGYTPAAVTLVSATEHSVTVEVSHGAAFLACFEYRSDGDTSQSTGANYNPLYPDLYPFVCLTDGSQQITIPADEYVEVRMVFGAESDERFDWVRFDVKEPQPYFNLAVCYEGELGEQATEARFGYFAKNLNEATVERNTVTNGGMVPQGIPAGENSARVWSSNTYALNAANYVWTMKIDGKQKTATIDKLGGKNSVVTEGNRCPQEEPVEPEGLVKQEAYVMAYTVPTEPIEGFENYTSCNVISYEQDGVLIDPSQERITMVCSKGPEDITGGLIYEGTVIETAIVYRWVDADGKVQRYTWRGVNYPMVYGKAEDAMYTMAGRKLDLYPRVAGASEWIRENAPDIFGD